MRSFLPNSDKTPSRNFADFHETEHPGGQVFTPPPFQLRAEKLEKPPTNPANVSSQAAVPPPIKENKTGLSDELKDKMEKGLGADLSELQIHPESPLPKGMDAHACAQGNQVHFAPGKFDPGTSKGQELIGHELTHVVQQKKGKVTANTEVDGKPVNDNESLENEADVIGRKIAASGG